MKIRNAYQYRQAINRLNDLYASEMLTTKQKNEMFALAEAVDAYELAHAEARPWKR